jgi:hypothetical protein
VIANTVAATGAVLVALQAAMFETGRVTSPALTADAAAGIANAYLSLGKKVKLPTQHDRGSLDRDYNSRMGTFLLVERSATSVGRNV